VVLFLGIKNGLELIKIYIKWLGTKNMDHYEQYKETQILIDKVVRKNQERFTLPKANISNAIIMVIILRLIYALFQMTSIIMNKFEWIIIWLWMIIGTSYLAWAWLLVYQTHFFQKLLTLNTKLYKTFSHIDETDTIIEDINTIRLVITRFSKMRKHLKTGKWWLDDIINNSIIQETHWLINIIRDLQSDLSIRLVEQQSLLKSAKWEVEKNINWTTELESVSELQKARLDRQIKQFEELQKVLIRT
jgi:hypothetical protein